MPESWFHTQLFVVLIVCGASVLLSSCGTGPESPELSEIARVEVTPDPVTTHYTAVFTLVVADSLGEPYRVAWQLARPDGSALDTLTDTQRFYWTAPSQPGEYTHSVRLETEEGEPLTEEYSFAVEVVPWNPPPADSTLSGKIVFSAQDSIGQYQIFTMDDDGTNLRQLTDWAESSTSPSWGPDGEQIVFSSFHGANNVSFPALWMMDADGSEARLLQEGGMFPLLGDNPHWSPDGGKIVYDYCIDCEGGGRNSEVFLYDFETDETKQLTDHTDRDEYPSWSPDGNRVIFRSRRAYDSYNHDLYLINVDKTGLTRLTNYGHTHLPVWGPDGYKVAFKSTDIPTDLYWLNISSNIISTFKENLPGDLFLYPHAWSPNGHKLLIGAWEVNNSEDYAFYTLNIETEKAKHIYTLITSKSGFPVQGTDWFIPHQ